VGRQGEGVAAYRKAIALKPELGEAWWSLANLKTVKFEEGDIDGMKKALSLANLGDEDRFHLDFALGKAMHDAGRADEAFEHYSRANALRLNSQPYRAEEITRAMHIVGGEARTIEGRLSTSDWLVGAELSAADLAVFPGIMLLRRALEKREAGELRSRFLPMETTYPALARWIGRVENLPGYDRTYPPHWREGAPRG